MLRDLDAEYDELMDELGEILQEIGSADCDGRIRVMRLRIEDLMREQMGLDARLKIGDRRTGPDALN